MLITNDSGLYITFLVVARAHQRDADDPIDPKDPVAF